MGTPTQNTRSSRGLGRALARCFAQRGHRVWLNGRTPEALELTTRELREQIGDRIVGATVADECAVDQVQALWAEACAGLGKVDCWINNAGVATQAVAPALELELSSLQRPIEVNLIGTLNCVHVVGRAMLERGGGTIYVMEGFGSDGKRTQIGLAAYGASKAGLRYLTRALREEWKGTGLRLGCISPGMVVTRLLLSPYGEAGPPPEVRRVFQLLADRPQTVAPFIVERVEAGRLDIVWLTTLRLLGRLLRSPFSRRDPLGSG